MSISSLTRPNHHDRDNLNLRRGKCVEQIHERNILFLCEDNAQLSQMAEAAAKHLSPPKTRIFSAGIKPGRIPASGDQGDERNRHRHG